MNRSRDYLNWIRQLLFSLFFALPLLVFNGCLKNEDLSGYDVQLVVPVFQLEGEVLRIVKDELAQKPFNTN